MFLVRTSFHSAPQIRLHISKMTFMMPGGREGKREKGEGVGAHDHFFGMIHFLLSTHLHLKSKAVGVRSGAALALSMSKRIIGYLCVSNKRGTRHLHVI